VTPLTVERFVGGREVEVKDVLALAQEHGVRMVDFKFTDLPGTWQHLGLSIHSLDPDAFTEGLGFDGSSIRGFQEISDSDMVLIPDASSAVIDPFHEQRTLSIICDVIDPITREPYSRDPRYVAMKAERHLAATGIADTCFMGPEAEFFIFDHVAFDQRAHTAFYEVDSSEAYWNMGRGFGSDAVNRNGDSNLGYKIRSQQGYFPSSPSDTHGDLRARMVTELEAMGVRCEFHHHEVGSAGQAEINVRFNTLLRMADQIQLQKYVIKNVAAQAGKTATFMPKPLFEENGSGMHVHQSLSKGGDNVMYDFNGYAQLSREALNYIGGILKHGRALMAFCAPTTNSYRRLVPGYEAPVNLVYSQRNRSAAVRIPVYSASQGQAPRIPPARSDGQSVSGVLGAVDGRAGRHPEPARPGSAGGRGPVRAVCGGAGGDQARALLARRCPGSPGRGSRVPATGRRVHRGPDPDLDRVQAQE
jgi:glutamine synthetase